MFFVALALDPLAQWFQIAKTRRKISVSPSYLQLASLCLSRLCDSESEHLFVLFFFVALALDLPAQWFQIAKTREKLVCFK